ncbi:Mitochondrial fission 1 protein [Hanseniaspora vineae]
MPFREQPSLEDAFGSLSAEQLDILKEQVLKEGGDEASIQSRFNYSWGLIRSNDVYDQRLGVKLLSDIYKQSPNRRRECLYYLTIGCYKMGEFSMAKRYVDALCDIESVNNRQVVELREMVESKITNETIKGVAIVSGIVGAIALGAHYLMRGEKRR